VNQRRAQYRLGNLVMLIILSGLIFALFSLLSRSLEESVKDTASVEYVAVAIGAWVLVWSVMRSRRRRLVCEECGQRFHPSSRKATGPALCPRCRTRHLTGTQRKKEHFKNLGTWLVLWAVASFLVGAFAQLGSSRSPRTSAGSWLAMAFLALGAIVGLLAVIIVVLVLSSLVRFRRLRNERYALAFAAKCAGREGEVVKSHDGTTTVWYSGWTDPAPMILEQRDTARGRFAAFEGETRPGAPIRVFCFDKRDAFLRFHMRIFPDLNFASLDGIYLARPHRMFTLCTEMASCRVTDPEKTARSLWTYAFLEDVVGLLPMPWIQMGLGKAVAAAGDAGELARLNRRMVASLDRGGAVSSDLFTLSPKDVRRLIRGSKEAEFFQKYQRLGDQSWSIVEYLCGERAPEERKAAFGAFLRADRLKVDQEGCFIQEFGFGFGSLLETWRQWVLDQGIGSHEPPPDRIRDSLVNRVLPVIRDHQCKRGDRILAIRHLGTTGYALGADTLISLLRNGDDIPKEEVVWALEMISGGARGEDPERWASWRAGLPDRATGELTVPSK
jgi:hypothetical protein